MLQIYRDIKIVDLYFLTADKLHLFLWKKSQTYIKLCVDRVSETQQVGENSNE